ncbi:unnamed protein product [Nippostrongylus brasiliensis]|uniref:Reverse transcriptase domain-containing protein n=1 Tax=Nippostrongylus brasiliensis TaxID=27835 RepID=A0A0N4XJZ0_NIPBR|nr:unnamed protein product [Nippostrongylus brasiliensis]
MVPEVWGDSIIVLNFKQNGDAIECSNYRGIKLISYTKNPIKVNIPYVYERLVDSKHRKMIPISEEQFGFMLVRSTANAIFTARQVMEKYQKKRKSCYLAFLDQEKAYRRLPREVLWRSLRKREVPEYVIQIITGTYARSRATARSRTDTQRRWLSRLVCTKDKY